MCHQLLCYGDANTYGCNPRSCLSGRYFEAVHWTALSNAEGWRVINKGENGRSIPRLGQEIETAVQTILRAKVEAAVIMLGSNDLLQCLGLTAEGCGEWMNDF